MKSNNILILIFMIICFSFITHPTFCQERLTVGEVTSSSGEIKSGYIIVPAGTDGPEIRLPITIVNGSMDGPVLALTAGIHGYEYPPVLALQRLRSQLDPQNIKGTVILVHVVNLPSFLKRTIYYNPYDWKNQNRVFPGKIDGTMTERIAYQITNEVLSKSDAHLDLHCGDGIELELEKKAFQVRTRKMQARNQYFLDGVVVETVRPSKGGFCLKCPKIRLTSDGRIKPCLMRQDNLTVFENKDSIYKAFEERCIHVLN